MNVEKISPDTQNGEGSPGAGDWPSLERTTCNTASKSVLLPQPGVGGSNAGWTLPAGVVAVTAGTRRLALSRCGLCT
jgi:hypothetical protein